MSEQRLHDHLVEQRHANGVAVLRIDREEALGALSRSIMERLGDYFAALQGDDEVRVLVLTGTGRGFIAGADITEYHNVSQAAFDDYQRLGRSVFTALERLPQTTIAAVNGYALGGGFELALACDLIIAREGARFGCPEINVGVFPFMISALIYRNVPRMKANELMLLGDPIDAAEAARLDIVNAVVPAEDFDLTVRTWAHTVAAKSPLLMKLGKNAIDATRDMAMPEALSALQAQLALALSTEDVVEGVSAFREKRSPVWRGR
jgi:enoyl-CoA hydratase/carnithine racemase